MFKQSQIMQILCPHLAFVTDGFIIWPNTTCCWLRYGVNETACLIDGTEA